MSSPRRIHWALHAPTALLVTALAHVLTVWALPRVIMDRIITLGAGEAARQQRDSGVFLPPPTDHTQRRIVMPSPDLLYASCAYDLTEQPVHIRFATDYPRYWSIALYASSSDNFFVVNDRDAIKGEVDLTLVGPEQAGTPSRPDTQLVRSPTRRGFLLLRVLVNDDPTVQAAAEQARRSLRCGKRLSP